MNASGHKIQSLDFVNALKKYLINEDEESLNIAYEFGRLTSNDGVNALDIIQLHHQTLANILSEYQEKVDLEILFQRASKFIKEALISVEIRNRGFESTVKQLREQNRTLNKMNLRLEDEVRKRKRANELLVQSKEYTQSIVDNSLDMIAILDEKGKYLFLSPSSERIIGYNSNELLGTKAFDRLHPDDVDAVLDLFEKGIKTPSRVDKAEYRIKHKDGSWRYLESIARNLLHHSSVHGVLVNSRDITVRKRVEVEIRKSQEKLRKLTKRIEEVREEERISIAREIHDELGQMLTVLKIDVSLLKDDTLKQMDVSEGEGNSDIESVFNTLLHRIDVIIRSVQRITNELRPEVLDKLGLVDAIKWEIKHIQARTDLTFDFQNNMSEGFLSQRFDDKQLLTIFRMFQESVINVVRHAGATRVNIALNRSDNDIKLEISDNGCGIRKNEINDSNSFGILGMRERALALGGNAIISGKPGEGTSVVIRLPAKNGDTV